MVEEIPFNREKRAIVSILFVFPGAPDADDFTSVALGIGDVLEIGVPHRVVPAFFQIVADHGVKIVLSPEIAVIDGVVVTAEPDPIIFCAE